MKQKRKVEEIPDCYHQSMGWGNLHYPLVENIAERADILSTGRLARGMIGMRHAIRGAHKVPFGVPSLLHCDPETWPDDRDNTVRVFIYLVISFQLVFFQSTFLTAKHHACI